MNYGYDTFFNSGLAETITYSGSLHSAIIVDAVELRDFYGIEVSTNSLSFFIKSDLYSLVSKNSTITYSSKNYKVKTKIEDKYDNRIIEITEAN